MNNLPDFDLDSSIAAATTWDTSALTAYQALSNHFTLDPEPPMHNTKDVTQLIVNGVHAVSLATQVAESTKPGTVAHQMALTVLKDWGVEIKLVPVDAETKEQPVLRWPPAVPTLDPVYTTHRYVVREDGGTAKLEPSDFLEPFAFISPPVFDDTPISPGEQFTFTGTAVWHQERSCYLMRMERNPGHTGNFWVFSKDVRVGDEIPPASAKE